MQVGPTCWISLIQQLNHITKDGGMSIRQMVVDLAWRRESNLGILGCHQLIEAMRVDETAYKEYKEGYGQKA